MNRLKKKYYRWRADLHVLSYPKSGRTWLRLMMSTLLHEWFRLEQNNLHQIHKIASKRHGIPCVYFTHDWRGLSDAKSGFKLETDKRRFAGKRVLLLIRDPKDVVVSNYFQKTYRENAFDGDISSFVRDPLFGIEGIVEYHNTWARHRNFPSQLSVVRYEDLRADAVNEVRRILELCGVRDIPYEHVKGVVERFEFDKMQKMEKAGAIPGKSTTPADAANPDSYKARSGKVGGYADQLSREDADYVERVVGDHLDPWYASYKGFSEPRRNSETHYIGA